MNSPITRDLDDPMEIDPYRPSEPVKIRTEKGASSHVDISKKDDHSINRYGPWICVATAAGFLGLGLALATMFFSWKDQDYQDRRNVDLSALIVQSRTETAQSRSELIALIGAAENRVIADNREKTTAFTLLDNHYRELKGKVEVQEKLYERR